MMGDRTIDVLIIVTVTLLCAIVVGVVALLAW
jgi:hypothetical protein